MGGDKTPFTHSGDQPTTNSYLFVLSSWAPDREHCLNWELPTLYPLSINSYQNTHSFSQQEVLEHRGWHHAIATPLLV